MSAANPQIIEQTYAEAAHLFQAGDLALAEARLTPVLRTDPPDARLHALAGFIRIRRGNPDGAMTALRRAVELAVAGKEGAK